MKNNLLLVSLVFVIAVAIVNAQKFPKLNRPVVDLNPKPHVTAAKLPEERRKLSIFPKSMAKYVITSKPYAKVRAYSTNEVTTKKLAMKIVPKETKTVITPITSSPIEKYTTFATTSRRLHTSRSKLATKPPVEIPEEVDYESDEDSYVKEPSSRHNVAYNSENNLSSFDEKDLEDNGEQVDQKLNIHSSEVVEDDTVNLKAVETSGSNKNKESEQFGVVRSHSERTKEDKGNDGTKEGIMESEHEHIIEPIYRERENIELTNIRNKRLSVMRRVGGSNNIIFSEKDLSKETSDVASEKRDRDEFIFIKNYLKVPVDIKKSANYEYLTADMDDEDVEIATEIAWLEEYHRPERSINIIEEENLGTTVAGFKFTGRERQIDNDLIFRNINA